MNPTRRVHDCFKWTHYHVVFDGGPFIWNWCIRKMPGIQWRAISQRWGRCHGKKRMHHCHGASQAATTATAAVFDPLPSIFITATNTLLLFTLCFHACRPCVSLSNSMVYPLDRNWAKTLSLTRTLLVRVRPIGEGLIGRMGCWHDRFLLIDKIVRTAHLSQQTPLVVEVGPGRWLLL